MPDPGELVDCFCPAAASRERSSATWERSTVTGARRVLRQSGHDSNAKKGAKRARYRTKAATLARRWPARPMRPKSPAHRRKRAHQNPCAEAALPMQRCRRLPADGIRAGRSHRGQGNRAVGPAQTIQIVALRWRGCRRPRDYQVAEAIVGFQPPSCRSNRQLRGLPAVQSSNRHRRGAPLPYA